MRFWAERKLQKELRAWSWILLLSHVSPRTIGKNAITDLLFIFHNEEDIVKSAVQDGYGLKGFESDIVEIISEFAGTVNMFLYHFFKWIMLLCKWEMPPIVYVRRRTCKGCKMCYKCEFLKCLNTKTCGPWIPAFLKVKQGASRERKLHPRCKDPSLKKYYVKFNCDYRTIFICELCTVCEQVGNAKRYYGGQNKSHKCPFGGTTDSNKELS